MADSQRERTTETQRCKLQEQDRQGVRSVSQMGKGKGMVSTEGKQINSDRKTLIFHMSKKPEALILPVHDSQGLSQVMGLQGGYLADSVSAAL